MTRRRIDVNAMREARGANQKEPVDFVVGDETFELPPELPLTFLERIYEGDAINALRHDLVGSEDGARLVAALRGEDLEDVAQAIAAEYGFDDLGNLEASGAS